MARAAFLRPNRLRAEALQSSPILPCRRNSNPYESRHQKWRTADSIHRSWLQGRTKVIKLPSKDLIMGQVKILKRGENLEPHSGEEDSPSSCLLDRFRPSSETETTRIHSSLKLSELDMLYAGPVGFIVSPPPSSLPLPAFLSKKKNDSFL